VPTRSIGIAAIPKECVTQIIALGENIKKARLSRKLRQEDIAKQVVISVKTYRKIEAGDPSVSVGLYLSTLYMLELNKEFSNLAANDKIGEALDRRAMPKRIKIKQNKELDF